MNLKKYFCVGKNEPEEFENLGLYSDMLGLNRDYAFVLSKLSVATEAEFQGVCDEAEKLLKNDLIRFGEDFYKIPNELRGLVNATVGSMTIIADNDGKVSVKFHKRYADGYWDDRTKKYPEKDTTGKWKHELFFLLENEE